MGKTIGYGRLSRDDGDDESTSIFNQKRIISEVVKDSIEDSIEEYNQNIVDEEDLASRVDLRNIVLTDSIMNRKKKK